MTPNARVSPSCSWPLRCAVAFASAALVCGAFRLQSSAHGVDEPLAVAHVATTDAGAIVLGNFGVIQVADTGIVWTPEELVPAPVTAWGLSGDGSTVLAGTQAGVYRSEDGGCSWDPTIGSADGIVTALATNGESDFVFVERAGGVGGLLESTDGGRQWEATTLQLDGLQSGEVIVGGDAVWVSAFDPASGRIRVWVGAAGGEFAEQSFDEALRDIAVVGAATTPRGALARAVTTDGRIVLLELREPGQATALIETAVAVAAAAPVGAGRLALLGERGSVVFAAEGTMSASPVSLASSLNRDAGGRTYLGFSTTQSPAIYAELGTFAESSVRFSDVGWEDVRAAECPDELAQATIDGLWPALQALGLGVEPGSADTNDDTGCATARPLSHPVCWGLFCIAALARRRRHSGGPSNAPMSHCGPAGRAEPR